MSISSISGASYYPLNTTNNANATTANGQNLPGQTAGAQKGAGMHHRHHGGGGLMESAASTDSTDSLFPATDASGNTVTSSNTINNPLLHATNPQSQLNALAADADGDVDASIIDLIA